MAVKEVIYMASERGDGFVERRKYSRIGCHIPCRFKVSNDRLGDSEIKGLIKNISAGGVLLEAPRKKSADINIEDSIYIKFTLELNDETMFVEAKGRIVHGTSNKFGVWFSFISDDVRERVLDYAGN